MNHETLATKYRTLIPFLNERQIRLYLATEAKAIGHGGIRIVARASGIGEARISRGIDELAEGTKPSGDVRKKGGGRKPHRELHPELVVSLRNIVAPETRGDPMSPLVWTTKSTRHLAGVLRSQGFQVSHETVAEILRQDGYSLQGNAKVTEGGQHEDRDAQFQFINQQIVDYTAASVPVLSMDCKKKELVGDFKNGGKEWHPKGKPEKVRVHDFMDKELGKAIPYGVYDVARNEGWVNVGSDHDTAEFAINSLRFWLDSPERKAAYPTVTELFICLDGGGSNNSRSRLWKEALVNFSTSTGIKVHVSHLPPGTSKWNKIEHRLFSHITMNWRGRPLISHEVVVQTIQSTTTKKGLKVHANLDKNKYETGKKVSD
ncbi:MAG: ISAzo13 family transposase, partial [Sulfobacillus sp.]